MSYETHTINDKLRITVAHWQAEECPLDYGLVTAYSANVPHSYYNATYGNNDNHDIIEEFQRLHDKLSLTDSLTVLNRLLELRNDSRRVKDSQWRGHSQGDWADFVVVYYQDDEPYLAGELADFHAWLSGDSFLAYTEELIQCHSERGEAWREWRPTEHDDSICFFDAFKTREEYLSFLEIEFNAQIVR